MILKMVRPILIMMSLLVTRVKSLMGTFVWIDNLMSSQWIGFVILKIIVLLHRARIVRLLY